MLLECLITYNSQSNKRFKRCNFFAANYHLPPIAHNLWHKTGAIALTMFRFFRKQQLSKYPFKAMLMSLHSISLHLSSYYPQVSVFVGWYIKLWIPLFISTLFLQTYSRHFFDPILKAFCLIIFYATFWACI